MCSPQSRTLEHYLGIFLGIYGSSCWWKGLTYMNWQVYNIEPSLCFGNSKYVYQYCWPNCHRGLSVSTLIDYFPSSLSHVNPTLVETLLDPIWKLHSGTVKLENRVPSMVIVNGVGFANYLTLTAGLISYKKCVWRRKCLNCICITLWCWWLCAHILLIGI